MVRKYMSMMLSQIHIYYYSFILKIRYFYNNYNLTPYLIYGKFGPFELELSITSSKIT